MVVVKTLFIGILSFGISLVIGLQFSMIPASQIPNCGEDCAGRSLIWGIIYILIYLAACIFFAIRFSRSQKMEYIVRLLCFFGVTALIGFMILGPILVAGPFVQSGDSTTHGGKVLAGSDNAFYEGIPTAGVGDLLFYPKRKGKHPIVSSALQAFDHPKPIARSGAKLIARRSAVKSQQGWIGPFDGQYDQQIVAVDAATGNPIHYYPFFIETEDGRTYMGRTDEEGKTPRIITQGKQRLVVYWGEEAILKGAE
jgi:uncharacterized Zn-binding protein involved in type VI secretion